MRSDPLCGLKTNESQAWGAEGGWKHWWDRETETKQKKEVRNGGAVKGNERWEEEGWRVGHTPTQVCSQLTAE